VVCEVGKDPPDTYEKLMLEGVATIVAVVPDCVTVTNTVTCTAAAPPVILRCP